MKWFKKYQSGWDRFWSAAIPLPLFNIGVMSRPGAARPRAEIDGVIPVPPFFIGPPPAKSIMRVSDDDGFVRPRTGGSRGWKNFATFENGSKVINIAT
jgi:hypothetical protein